MFSYIDLHLSRKVLKTLILCYFLSNPLSFHSFTIFQNFSKRFLKHYRFKIKNPNLALTCKILATIFLFSTVINVRALTNQKHHQSFLPIKQDKVYKALSKIRLYPSTVNRTNRFLSRGCVVNFSRVSMLGPIIWGACFCVVLQITA